MKTHVLLAVSLAAPFFQAAATTHCKPTEVVYFSCELKDSKKVVSLCGDDTGLAVGPEPSWLQYRFGEVGHPELIYPLQKKGSLGQFRGVWHHHAMDQHSTAEFMSFKSGLFVYTIASIDKGDRNDESSFFGVWVEKGKETIRKSACSSRPEGRFREAITAVPQD